MTTDARPDTSIGVSHQGLLERVARCCEPSSWARSRGWLAQAGRLSGTNAAGDVSPEDWASLLMSARPALQLHAQGLVRAMARQVWRLDVRAPAAKGASAQLHAVIHVGGQRWQVGLALAPQLQVVALSKEGQAAA